MPDPTPPPPVPRKVPRGLVWRLLQADIWFIGAIVAEILGLAFLLTGIVLFSLVDAALGWPFLITGGLALTVSGPLLIWRVLHTQPYLRLFSEGRSVRGEVLEVAQNRRVRVNRQHPWVVRYRFDAAGQPYEGIVQRLDLPDHMLQVGQAVYVLYFPEDPARNTLYVAN